MSSEITVSGGDVVCEGRGSRPVDIRWLRECPISRPVLQVAYEVTKTYANGEQCQYEVWENVPEVNDGF